jgi:hypothetical protein
LKTGCVVAYQLWVRKGVVEVWCGEVEVAVTLLPSLFHFLIAWRILHTKIPNFKLE